MKAKLQYFTCKVLRFFLNLFLFFPLCEILQNKPVKYRRIPHRYPSEFILKAHLFFNQQYFWKLWCHKKLMPRNVCMGKSSFCICHLCLHSRPKFQGSKVHWRIKRALISKAVWTLYTAKTSITIFWASICKWTSVFIVLHIPSSPHQVRLASPTPVSIMPQCENSTDALQWLC